MNDLPGHDQPIDRRPNRGNLSDGEWQRLVPQIQAQRERHKALTRGYRTAVTEVARLLFAADPIGLNFGTNTDEYEPEAASIVALLPRAASEADAVHIVFSEFQRWFGADNAGPRSSYERVSSDIWRVWETIW